MHRVAKLLLYAAVFGLLWGMWIVFSNQMLAKDVYYAISRREIYTVSEVYWEYKVTVYSYDQGRLNSSKWTKRGTGTDYPEEGDAFGSDGHIAYVLTKNYYVVITDGASYDDYFQVTQDLYESFEIGDKALTNTDSRGDPYEVFEY